MTIATVPPALLWLDVETTGTNPVKDSLLQAAGFITDESCERRQGGFNYIIRHDDPEAEKAKATPYVQAMHEETGLWDALPGGLDLTLVDKRIHAYVQGHTQEGQEVRLAGNSVRLDLNFVEAYLPQTYSLLTYRMLDVSSIAFFAKSSGLIEDYYEKRKTHNALDDINESLEEYLEIFRKVQALTQGHKP